MKLLWLERLAVAVVMAGASIEGTRAADSTAVQIVPNIPHYVNSLAFSPDNRQVVSGGQNSTAKLWDLGTGRLLRTFIGHTDQVASVAFSPDGTTIASGSGDDTLKLWDVATGRLLRTVAQKSSTVSSIRFLRDGKRLVFVGDDGLNVLDIATGAVVLKMVEAYTTTVAVSPDNSRFASGRQFSNSVKIWDAVSGKLLRELRSQVPEAPPLVAGNRDRSNPVSITSVAFTPDNSRVAAGSSDDRLFNPDGVSDHVVNIWDIKTGRLLTTISAHSASVTALAFSPNGALGCSAGSDKTIQIWNVASGKVLRAISTANAASALAFSADGRNLLSSGGDRLQLWDIETGKLLREFGSDDISPVESANFSPTEDKLVSVSHDTLHIWDLTTGTLSQRFGGGSVARFLPDGERLLSGGSDGLKTWTAKDGIPIQNIGGKLDWTWASSLALSHDGSRVLRASGREDSQLEEWSVAQGKMSRRYMAFAGVRSVAYSPDDRLIGAGVGSVAKFWDANSGKPAGAFTPFPNWDIASLAFSHNGRRVLFGGSSGSSLYDNLILVDASSGRILQKFPGHSGTVSSVAMSRDDLRVLSGSQDGTARLWDTASGRLLRTYAFSQGAIKAVEFSPDGRRALSAGDDGAIRILDLDNGELIATLLEFNGGEWVTITPEGFFVASDHGAEHLSVVRGLNVFGINQVYQSLCRPDLVREKLAGDPRGLVREAAARLDLNKVIASGSAPDVKLRLPTRALGSGSIDADQVSVEAELSNRGGGVGRVEWRINGVTVGVDTPALPAAVQTVQLTHGIGLEPGANDISVVAYNSANLVASVPAHLSLVSARSAAPAPAVVPAPSVAPMASPTVKPRLFVLVAGINDYSDERIRLAYAVSDAREVARGFNEAAGNLYQSVEVRLLTDADVTRGKLDAAFQAVAAKAQASDVFVLYLAGHGKTVDGRYYFIPQDFAVTGSFDDHTIHAAVKDQAITQDQLQRWFALVPARRSVILFDTCDSGTLTGEAGETQKLERGIASDRLAEATGRSIITASAGTQEALEGYRGHGLFTYELLDGLNRADSDGNGSIEVIELAAYVYAQVSETSQKVFNQRQAPQMKITANYPLTKQTRILQDDATPVAESKPTYQLMKAAQIQVQPSLGATVVRSLSANTAVSVLENKDGWALIAANGKTLGYVATRDLARLQ